MTGAMRDLSKLLSGNVIARGVGFATTMLFARLLAKEQMAIFPVYLMLNGIAVIVLDFGVTPLFSRLLPSLLVEDFATARSLYWTGLVIVLGGAAIVSALTAHFAHPIALLLFHDSRHDVVISTLAIGFVAYALSTAVSYVMVARSQFSLTSVLQVVESLIRPVLAVAAFFLLGLEGIALALVAAQFVIAALSVWCIRDVLFGRIPKVFSPGVLFSQSLPFYFDSYLFYLRGEGDNWLVSLFLGPQALAAYFIAKTIFSATVMLLQSLDKVVVQRFGRHRNVQEEFNSRVRNFYSLTVQFAVPGLLLAIALTPLLVTILGGARYHSATVPAVLLMLVAMVQFLILPIDRAVFVALSPLYRLAKTALETAVVFVSAFLLAPLAAASGIAAARVIGEATGGVYGWMLLRRHRELVLNLRDLWLSLAAAGPGTVGILLLAPRPANALNAVLLAPVLALCWIVCFSVLARILNPAQFQSWVAVMGRIGPLKATRPVRS